MNKILLAVAATGFVVVGLPMSSFATIIHDGDFSVPNEGAGNTAYVYNPTGTAWTFAGGSGVTALPSYWAEGPAAPPASGQVAFLQGVGADISQLVTVGSAGTYLLSWDTAGRPATPWGQGGNVTYTVSVTPPGTSGGTSTTTGANFYSPVAFTAYSFLVNLAVGSTVVDFDVSSVNPAGTDESAFIDNVSLTPVPEASTIVSGALMLLPLGVSVARIMRKNLVA